MPYHLIQSDHIHPSLSNLRCSFWIWLPCSFVETAMVTTAFGFGENSCAKTFLANGKSQKTFPNEKSGNDDNGVGKNINIELAISAWVNLWGIVGLIVIVYGCLFW